MGTCCSNERGGEEQAFNRQVTARNGANRDVDKAMNFLQGRNNTFMKINLSFTAKDLPNMDRTSKTDSFLVVFELVKGNEFGEAGNWVERGRTEIVVNNNSPTFVQTIAIDYYFEQDQEFLVLVHDSDHFESEKVSLVDSNYIGQSQFKIQTLVCNREKEVTFPLHDQKGAGAGSTGFIKVNYEEDLCCTNQNLKFTPSMFEGDFMENKSYFIEIYKIKNHLSGESVKVFRSEKCMYNSETLAPFSEINIPVDNLLSQKNSNVNVHEISIKIVIKQYNTLGDHPRVCEVVTNIGNLLSGDSLVKLSSENPQQTFSLKKNKCQLQRVHSFLDYINNGCEMSLITGVDFTGSNLQGLNGQNLHCENLEENKYFNAIKQISGILMNFDKEKQVPLYGFGAVIDDKFYNGKVSHCFALNGNSFRPEVFDIAGIEASYVKAASSVLYAGPTFFAPLLKRFNEMVKFECERNQRKYYTFLILTDGMIHDINDTVEQIVISSRLPVSIIIIGIGSANFSEMVFLDGDDSPLFCKNTQTFSKRDNVQFVEYQKYENDLEKLARETLEELPAQMVDFFQKQGIEPEDMGITQQNLEIRDYSSYKAMNLISGEEFNSQVPKEKAQEILQKGIADPDTVCFENLLDGYENVLKI